MRVMAIARAAIALTTLGLMWLSQRDRGASKEPSEADALAYDAASLALSQQDQTLGSLRNRATGLLSVAALAVTFVGSVGLVSGDAKLERVFPTWAALALVLIVVLVGACVMNVLWPASFHFGPDPVRIVDLHGKQRSDVEIRREVTAALIQGMASNVRVITRKQRAFRLAAGLLLLEVLLISAVVLFE